MQAQKSVPTSHKKIYKLDKLAMEYTGNDRRKANNCVFGYIRGISTSYCDEGENGGHVGYIDSIVNKWTSTAGKIDKGFVNFVASNEKVDEITFPEFFASFVQDSDDYNSYLYGAVDSSFLNKRYKVPAPYRRFQYNKVFYRLRKKFNCKRFPRVL